MGNFPIAAKPPPILGEEASGVIERDGAGFTPGEKAIVYDGGLGVFRDGTWADQVLSNRPNIRTSCLFSRCQRPPKRRDASCMPNRGRAKQKTEGKHSQCHSFPSRYSVLHYGRFRARGRARARARKDISRQALADFNNRLLARPFVVARALAPPIMILLKNDGWHVSGSCSVLCGQIDTPAQREGI
jgi:hypothetical protein